MYRCYSAPANYRVVHLVIFLYLLIYIWLGWQANLGEAQTDISPAPNWILVLLMLLPKLNKLLLAILLFPPIFVADRHITCDEFNLPFLLVLLMVLPKLSNRWGTANHDFTLRWGWHCPSSIHRTWILSLSLSFSWFYLPLRLLTMSILNTPDRVWICRIHTFFPSCVLATNPGFRWEQ